MLELHFFRHPFLLPSFHFTCGHVDLYITYIYIIYMYRDFIYIYMSTFIYIHACTHTYTFSYFHKTWNGISTHILIDNKDLIIVLFCHSALTDLGNVGSK